MLSAEKSFFEGSPAQAVASIKYNAAEAGDEDKLVYYLEAGITLHTAGDYEQSNNVFQAAQNLIDEYRTSVSDEVSAFILNERGSEYHGEIFEHVLVGYYRALNFVLLNQKDAARKTLQKLELDMRTLKYDDAAYKQVLAARYLSALLAEDDKDWNTARVQYKNFELFKFDSSWLNRQKYILAKKENDLETIRELELTIKDNRQFDNIKEKGQLVIIHQAGKAPVKKSRGKLAQDQKFWLAMRVAIDAAILSEGSMLSSAAAVAALGTAENPIPEYVFRDPAAAKTASLTLNDQQYNLQVLTDYESMATHNFNDQYDAMVAKSTASLAVKFVSAAVASYALGKSADEAVGGGLGGAILKILIGGGAGAAVAQTLKPDLRCWRTLPANIQMQRIILEPGTYTLTMRLSPGVREINEIPAEITIEAGKTVYVNLRSFTPGVEAIPVGL